MSIAKSKMTIDGNTVHVSMPFAKVDKDERLVSGFATLDNIDSQGDVVMAEASANAFARARGNIREMHQPLAVGRMVDFKEEEFFDKSSSQFYRGIYVTARVSEGAEDTWKKVLDGTLTGFSIGGEINDSTNEFSKDAGKTVRVIKDYDLVELSLVDNPANQLANVLSIQKTSTGSVVKGMAVETKIENVFVCSKHDEDVVSIRETEADNCPLCGAVMENAGWFESGADRTEKVRSIVEKFLNPAETEAAPISDEGGVVMGTENKSEEVSEETAPEEEPAGTEEEDSSNVDEAENLEETETPEEVEDESTLIVKKIDELSQTVQSSLEKSRTETVESISLLEERLDDAKKEFIEKASELEKKIDGFGENLATAKGRLAELESSFEKLNSSDAVRKSADLSDNSAVEIVQKDSSWNGAFSGKRATRFSVDNLM